MLKKIEWVAILCLISIVVISIFFMVTEPSSTNISNEQEHALGVATFAGGCFWCMESPYDNLEGVLSTTVGYTGGDIPNPSYEQVTTGKTGHLESVQIRYDPSKITYAELLDVFWRNIDPTNDFGQFADFGTHYRTAVFYHNDEQRYLAEESKAVLAESGKFDKPIVTDIRPAAPFYNAEDYHQDYYRKNPVHYNAYKKGSGRTDFLHKMWGDTR